MSNAAFVLMNCDLVAVPLQLDPTRVLTVYCGKQRANQLLGSDGGDLGSVDRRAMPGGECDRIYAQSASGSRSSHRTSPPDSRSSKMHSSARNA